MNLYKYIGAGFVCISLVLLVSLLLSKNERFFNIREVFSKHFNLFKECKSQYFVFYIIPLLLAIGLAMIYEADSLFYSELSIVLGIIISMLFAILAMLTSNDYRDVKSCEEKGKVKKVAEETTNAIVFNCILCLFLLLFCLIMIVLQSVDFDMISTKFLFILKKVFSGIAYYLFTVILLTLFLIIKHMSKIIHFNLVVKKKGDSDDSTRIEK